jgi:hypothetical protein
MVMIQSPKKNSQGSGVEAGRATLEAPMQRLVLVENADPKSASRSQLYELFPQILSTDDDQIKQGIEQIRLILGDQDPPLAEVVAIEGALPRLLQLLEHADEETRWSAAMCVMKLACGGSDITEVVLKHDGGIKCLQLLAPDQPESIREVMAWAVANLAGSGLMARDVLLAQNAMGIVIGAITANLNNTLPTLHKLTWAMRNLCRHEPTPPLEAVAPALPVCYYLMQHSDTAVQDAACWAASYISDGPHDHILACQTAGLFPIVLELLRTQRSSVMLPAIRSLGNYAAISADAAQGILEMGVLQLMVPLMQPDVKRSIRKECCWILSNVASGEHAHVQAVLDSGLMPCVIRCMSDPELGVNREAVWVIANIGAAGTPDQLRAAVEHFDCIPGLCTALCIDDEKIRSTALQACEDVLAVGDSLRSAGTGVNPYVERFKEQGLVGILSILVDSPDDTVRSRSSFVVSHYLRID